MPSWCRNMKAASSLIFHSLRLFWFTELSTRMVRVAVFIIVEALFINPLRVFAVHVWHQSNVWYSAHVWPRWLLKGAAISTESPKVIWNSVSTHRSTQLDLFISKHLITRLCACRLLPLRHVWGTCCSFFTAAAFALPGATKVQSY